MSVAELGYRIDSNGAVIAHKNLDVMTASAIKAEAAEKTLAITTRSTDSSVKTFSTTVSALSTSIGSASQAVKAADSSFKGLGAELAATQRESALYRAEMDAVRAQFNPLFAASKQYEAQLERISSAERIGAISALEASAARKHAAASMSMANSGMVKYSKSTTAGAAQTANLGAQLNDIGVMLAAGQNPLQLAVQQGTQINQVFNQMGGGANALRGLGAGFMSMVNPMSLATIGVIAGGAALTQWAVSAVGTASSADELADRYEALESVTTGLTAANDLLEMSMQDLIEVYGDAAVRVREFAVLQSELKIAELTDSLSKQSSVLAEVTSKYTAARTGLIAIRNDFDLSKSAAFEFSSALTKIKNADSFEAQVSALQDINALFKANGVAASDIPPELAKALSEMIDLSNETDAALRIADDLASAVSEIAPNIDPAVTAAAELKVELGSALALLNRINQQESLVYSGRGGNPADFLPGGSKSGYESELNYESPQEIIDAFNAEKLKSSKRSRGGRAKRDTYGSDLDSLIESLATERETVDAWYNESQTLLADQRSMELLGQEGHAQAKLRIEEEYQQRLSDIRNGYQGSALDQTEAFMGGMAAALQGGNDKMQAAAQAFASVEALINAYRAYNQVMADPRLPWFAKIPAAAGVLAAGMKTVQSIKSLSGSGGSSSSASAPSATSSTSSTSQQSAIIQVTGGRTRYTIDEINDIIAGIQDASTDGVIIEGFTS